MIMIIFASVLSITTSISGEEEGLELEIDVQGFKDRLFNSTVMGPVHLDWKTMNSKGSDVLISIYIGQNIEGWRCLEYDIQDTGSFILDPELFQLENGNGYTLRVMAFSKDGRYHDGYLGFSFSIMVTEMFDVDVDLDLENGTAPDEMMVSWELSNDPICDYDILLDVMLNETMEPVLTTSIHHRGNNAWIDTSSLLLDETYFIRITVTDVYGREASNTSMHFVVRNYVVSKISIPTFGFMEPEEGSVVWEEMEISWIPHPDLDQLYQVLTDLYLRDERTGMKTYIARNHQFPNTRMWDPSIMERGQYKLYMDSWMIDGTYSSSYSINISICDQSSPVIQDLMTTTIICDTYAHFIWTSYTTEEIENDHFSVHIIYHHPRDGDMIVGDSATDDGEMWIDTTDLPEGKACFTLKIFNGLFPALSDEREIREIIIDHPTAPVISPVTFPDTGDDLMGEIKLSWRTWDPDGDHVRVSLFYRCENGDPIRINDPNGGNEDHVFWNTTELRSGTYSLKFIAYDSSYLNLTDTYTTGDFTIFGKEEPSIRSSRDGQKSDGSSRILLIITFLSFLMIISIVGLAMIIRRRREQKKLCDADLDTIPIDRNLVDSCIRMREDTPMINNALPDIGMSSAPSWDRDLEGENSGNIIVEPLEGSVEEALDILGPTVNDEVTMDDLMAYMILDVPHNATDIMIGSAYKKFARRFHPDKFRTMSLHLQEIAEQEMRRRNRAKEVLLDHRRRAILDSMLRDNGSHLIREMGISRTLLEQDHV